MTPPRAATALAASLLLVVAAAAPAPVAAQPAPPRSGGWEASAGLGAIRLDDDFAASDDAAWRPVVSGALGWRATPRATLWIGAWRHLGDGESGPAVPAGDLPVWGAGVELAVTPWPGRWAVDPVLLFGLESVRADDDLERSAAFVGGVAARLATDSAWALEISLRNRFLTIEEEPVEGVQTGRDASLWHLGAGVSYRPPGP
ncbi:MAG: hypothetical protein R3199_06885 [Gemmatimonadota bacterium]|nr:hypothetical protein [Gemmatimonadota bacterium]